jgi:hypothetical protein
MHILVNLDQFLPSFCICWNILVLKVALGLFTSGSTLLPSRWELVTPVAIDELKIYLAELFRHFWIGHFFRNQKWRIFFSKFKRQASTVIFISKLIEKLMWQKSISNNIRAKLHQLSIKISYALILYIYYALIIKTGNRQGKNLEFWVFETRIFDFGTRKPTAYWKISANINPSVKIATLKFYI